MAAQYIDRNEFTNGLNALYAKITRYIDNRFEGLNGQILADKTDTSERLDRVEKRLDGVEKRLDGIEGRLDKVETRLDSIEHYQKDLLETFQATTRDILKSIADSHAILMERINDIDRK